jgi:hypothetical protein
MAQLLKQSLARLVELRLRVPASVARCSFQAIDTAEAPPSTVQRLFVSHPDDDLDKAVMRVKRLSGNARHGDRCNNTATLFRLLHGQA